MTWGLNTRTSATWGEENAPTLQEHFNCSQDFRCSLYGLLIFYLFARDPWCYANVTSSFQKFKECFVKCIVFASKELGSVLRPSPLCTDSLIIGWYVIRCSFEAMGNAAEFFFFKEASGHTLWQMIWDANVGLWNMSTSTAAAGIFTSSTYCKTKHRSSSLKKKKKGYSWHYHCVSVPESKAVVLVHLWLNPGRGSQNKENASVVLFQP